LGQFDILVNSSGAKIKHLKSNQLEAPPGAESARGIYSILHEHAKPTGGYII
jgi:large subunit ribosomal protein L43